MLQTFFIIPIKMLWYGNYLGGPDGGGGSTEVN